MSVAAMTNNSEAHIESFSFGDPEEVLGRRGILDLLECRDNGRWYEPPVPREGLARAFNASPHHSSAIILKRNMLRAAFEPTPLLSGKDFAAAVLDYLVFGDLYLEIRLNRLGTAMRLDHVLAKYTRRGLVDGQYFFLVKHGQEEEFRRDAIVQVSQPDINQELYGVPEYLSALQSALLNEAATLFRRRYFRNGSHAGYIMYASGDFNDGDVNKLRDAMKAAKGPGNFRNMFVHSPKGSENAIKIIPISQVGASDEFLGIKGATRDDVLAAHRVPPQLLGIVPAQGSSGFGNPLQAADMFFDMEIVPIQAALLEVNERLGVEAIRFKERIRAAA